MHAGEKKKKTFLGRDHTDCICSIFYIMINYHYYYKMFCLVYVTLLIEVDATNHVPQHPDALWGPRRAARFTSGSGVCLCTPTVQKHAENLKILNYPWPCWMWLDVMCDGRPTVLNLTFKNIINKSGPHLRETHPVQKPCLVYSRPFMIDIFSI